MSYLTDQQLDSGALNQRALNSLLAKNGNLLPIDVASASSISKSTGAFVFGAATGASSTTYVWGQNARSIQATRTGISPSVYPQSSTPALATPIVGGAVITCWTVVYNPTASTQSIFMYAPFYDASGTNVGGNGAVTSLPPGAWTQVYSVLIVPAKATRLRQRWIFNSLLDGESLYFGGFGAWYGAGGIWQLPGYPIASQSGVRSNLSFDLSGTGSPEGVIPATPGSTYLQTDSTIDVKGWIRWNKATGTSTAGWKVGAEYDSGARVLDASLENSWSGIVRLQRKGDLVSIFGSSIVGTAATISTIYTLPTGFKRLVMAEPGPAWYTATGGVPTAGVLVSTADAVILGPTIASFTTGRFKASWFTSDTVPTVLPGS